ncbi:MAG: Hsp20/alpha crystallin family protein [Bernardetiaceae bacterium]|jgi:HSP20 family protein|nr:Hsp20/alpha crystallin family protein [Bernardetiaceae bacterium]
MFISPHRPFQVAARPFFAHPAFASWAAAAGNPQRAARPQAPRVNVQETADGYWLELATPGFAKENLQIEVEGQVLKVSGQKAEAPEAKYRRQDFGYPTFERAFHLPKSVDAEQVSAQYENGVLRLWLPKKAEAKPQPARQIAVA